MAKKVSTNADLIRIYESYRTESEWARRNRMELNKANYNSYHMRQDYGHKQKGQSVEFLPKQSMAVEMNTNIIQQGLIDIGDWFRVHPEVGLLEDLMKIKPSEMKHILEKALEKDDFMSFVGGATKTGLLASLMIAKVGGRFVPKPKFTVETKLKNGRFTKKLIKQEDKVWELEISLVRPEDYFPDPSGRGLYEIQDSYMDFYEVEILSQGENAIYDKGAIKELRGSFAPDKLNYDANKARETGQNTTTSDMQRHRVKVSELWGNIVNFDGELIHENVVLTVANDNIVLRGPEPNPLWHGESPFVTAPLLDVPHSVWGKALMDAPTQLNKAFNELFNLSLDGGMMSVHGIKQIREDWLEDASQVEDGIDAGTTLRANSSTPPGAKVLERVDTATVPQDAMNILNLLQQEFNTAALTNDLRQGVQSQRSVKATEVIAASQSLASMNKGMAMSQENKFIRPILEKSWKTIAQNIHRMDEDIIKSLLGPNRAAEVLSLSAEDVFAETVQGAKFDVFGISENLTKQQDFTKIQAFLQTVAGSPVLLEEFVKDHDLGKLLQEIMLSLDIDPTKLKFSPEEELAKAKVAEAGAVQNQQEGADTQSQIPQAGAEGNQSELTQEGQLAGQAAAEGLTPPDLGGNLG